MSRAALASFLLLFGGSLIIAGLSTGDAPKGTIPALACVFLGIVGFGFVDAARDGRDKDT